MEKKQSKRTRVVGARITEDEFKIIENRWKKTTCIKISDYLRKVIFNKPVVTAYRNKSMDDLMTELSLLRQELNRIGVNYNQSVKKLHTLRDVPEFKRWLIANEVEKRTLGNKIEEIKNHVKKIAQSWLQ
ncbi:MAG: plasmid mobilization relaxosome protein MobC [Flavobacteriia bacterium]|nr:plasmid mobilization relaxosome protein MobC [Flavobacteriia bacterium]OJX36605.1 MAG: mobilization protein [Flavobacteriia bacterium 40-80]